jgi:hypothetical protein
MSHDSEKILICPACGHEADMFKMAEHWDERRDRRHQKLCGGLQDAIEEAAMIAELDAQLEFMMEKCKVKE